MFLRRMGRKILLLHSMRDGSGRVSQSRLGHFESGAEAVRKLGDAAWRQQLQTRYPDLRCDGKGLLERARELEHCAPAKRQARVRKPKALFDSAVNTLQRLIEQDSSLRARTAVALLDLLKAPSSAEETGAEFRERVWRTGQKRRIRLDRDEPEAVPHYQALRELADHLQQHGQLEECCEVRGRLAERFPCPQTWLDYGVALQRQGRGGEALEQYARLPARESLRHYHTASVLCGRGDLSDGLQALSRAMNLDRDVAEGLVQLEKGQTPRCGAEYWQLCGDLWNAPARRFFLNVYNQSLVKMTLAWAQRLGVLRRRLFGEQATRVVLQDAADGVRYRLLRPRTAGQAQPDRPSVED